MRIFIVSIVLFFLCCSGQEKQKVFKVLTTINFNDKPFEKKSFIVGKNIIIEPIITKLSYYEQTISIVEGPLEVEKINEKDSLEGYFLTHIDGRYVFKFGKEYDYKGEINLLDKTGFNNFGELPEIKPFLSKFKKNKDSLEYISKDSTSYIIKIDTSLYDEVLFHPISKFLDEKFKGICTSLMVSDKQSKTVISYEIKQTEAHDDLKLFKIFNKQLTKLNKKDHEN